MIYLLLGSKIFFMKKKKRKKKRGVPHYDSCRITGPQESSLQIPMHGTSCFGIGAFCARYSVPGGLPLTSGEERFGEMGLNHREGSGDSVLQLKIEYRFCNLPEEGTFCADFMCP